MSAADRRVEKVFQITDRASLRRALRDKIDGGAIHGLCERNRISQREMLCRKFEKEQRQAERAQMKACRKVINDGWAEGLSMETIQIRLTAEGLIPRIVKLEPKGMKRTPAQIKERNRAKRMRRSGNPEYAPPVTSCRWLREVS